MCAIFTLKSSPFGQKRPAWAKETRLIEPLSKMCKLLHDYAENFWEFVPSWASFCFFWHDYRESISEQKQQKLKIKKRSCTLLSLSLWRYTPTPATHIHTQTHTLTYSHTHTNTHTHTHTQTHTQAHTHSNTHTHTQTQTHTGTRNLPRGFNDLCGVQVQAELLFRQPILHLQTLPFVLPGFFLNHSFSFFSSNYYDSQSFTCKPCRLFYLFGFKIILPFYFFVLLFRQPILHLQTLPSGFPGFCFNPS